jgi:hypothetical protein
MLSVLDSPLVWSIDGVDKMEVESKESDGVEELTLDEEPIAADGEPIEVIHVPVEELGQGLFNALGDLVGGMVGLKNSTAASLKGGVEIIKERVSPSPTVSEDLDPLIVEAELVDLEEDQPEKVD